MKANTQLRENLEKIERDLDAKDVENTQLNIENQQLRERVELVEGILKNNSAQLSDMVSSDVRSEIDKSNTIYGRFNNNGSNIKANSRLGANVSAHKRGETVNGNGKKEESQEPITVDGVYNELIDLRKMNKILGDRIKQLEVMNFRMTS